MMKIPVWISPMGSRPSFCTNVSKFLTSAIIKWWFSTSRGLRKMTTWYCYKMKMGFYHEVTWRGNSTTTKWRLVFICFYHQVTWREQQLPLLQNEIRFLHVVFWWANSFATKWLSILKFFQLPKRWKLIKCNSQAVGTKCLAHPHFFILI